MAGGRGGASGVLLALVVALALTLSLGVDRAASQQATPRTVAERRALEHAERLKNGDRLPEAQRVLQALLEAEPLSLAGLSALYDVSDELGDLISFVPFVEHAGRELGTENGDVQRLWVHGLLGAGMTDSAHSVAGRWTNERPTQRDAYAMYAEVEASLGRSGAAVAVLLRGRSAVGDAAIFTRELAALYAEVGDLDALAGEWLRILESEPDGAAWVWEAIRSLQRDPAPALGRLWSDLRRSTSRGGRREGMRLALRSREVELARELAESLVATASAGEDRALLRAFVAEATAAESPDQVAWAAGELAERAPDRGERLRWRAVAADMALAASDSSGARAAFEALLRDAEPRTSAHRLASRRLFSLLAADAPNVSRAEQLYREYRGLYEDSVIALAGMVSELSHGYVHADRPEDARRVLDEAPETSDPDARAVLEGQRGLLALYDGELEAAALHLAAPALAAGLHPATRTGWIELLAVVERADSVEGRQLGETLLRLARDPAGTSAAAELAVWESIPVGEARSAILALLAHSFDAAGRPAEASAVRSYLVRQFPDGPEAALAMLGLARSLEGTDAAASRAWLERLITGYPESAVAPIARRLLADLTSGGGG